MMKRKIEAQKEMEFVSIDDLVPSDHILRKVQQMIDFSFVRERMEPLYCLDNGRPAIDPVILFKMLFIGYFFGVRSERQLVRDIQVNVAYRWFLGYGLQDKIPHSSTISQNRRRRFNGSDVFREMFDDVVLLALRNGFVDGKTLYTDSTHLKANANKHKYTKETVSHNTKKYIDDLEQSISEDRKEHGKKPLSKKPLKKGDNSKEIKRSKTDPDSGFMTREGKPQGFFYLDHRTTDNKFNIITDVYLTPANIYDSLVYLDRLDYQIDKFGFEVSEVGLDAGYNTPDICHGLVNRDIFGVVGYRKPGGLKGRFRKNRFRYDQKNDYYVCPEGKILNYRTTNRNGYREYVSNKALCIHCPSLLNCTQSKNHQKVITRHVWGESRDQINSNRYTDRGKYIKRRRSETVERSFADAKQLHGYRYARFRGRKKVEAQCLMTAIVQNIKKIVTLVCKNGSEDLFTNIFNIFALFFSFCEPNEMKKQLI
jgi:transposase